MRYNIPGLVARTSGIPLGTTESGWSSCPTTSSSATSATTDAAGSNATSTTPSAAITARSNPATNAHRPTSLCHSGRLHGQLATSSPNSTQPAASSPSTNHTCSIIRRSNDSLCLNEQLIFTHHIRIFFFFSLSYIFFSHYYLFFKITAFGMSSTTIHQSLGFPALTLVRF